MVIFAGRKGNPLIMGTTIDFPETTPACAHPGPRPRGL